MNEPTTYEIVIKGRASSRLLRPLLDDFSVDHLVEGSTRLTGVIRDGAHLHGVVAHLTSVSVELISIAPLASSVTATVSTDLHTITKNTINECTINECTINETTINETSNNS